MRYDFKPISPTSWLISVGGNKQGMCIQKNDQFHLVGIAIARDQMFASFSEIETKLKIQIQFEEVSTDTKSEEQGDIAGFPVKHLAYNISDGDRPTYTKTENSDVLYAAGYWGILFPNGWVLAFCPKHATLDQYKTRGPFKTKLEANHAINQEKTKSEELQ